MTWPDTTIEGKLFGVDTKFSFIRPIKRFEKSYYKLSLYGNLGEISKCSEGTSLLVDVQNTIKDNLDKAKPSWENITIQVQIIYKPHSIDVSIEQIKKDVENKELADLEKDVDEAKKEYEKASVEYDKSNIALNAEEAKTEVKLRELIRSPGYEAAKSENEKCKKIFGTTYSDLYRKISRRDYKKGDKTNLTAKDVLEQAKENYKKAPDGIDKYLPNNSIWIIGVKVDFGNLLSSDNGNFKFSSFAVSFSYFGGEVSEDDKDCYKGKIDFIDGGDKSDEIFLKTQAIIEQNKVLKDLIEKNIPKTTTEPKIVDEAALKKSLQDRIIEKWKSVESKHKKELKLFPLSESDQSKRISKDTIVNSDLEGVSFDELTMLSFQIYEASK